MDLGFLLINVPQVAGLGLIETSLLPCFESESWSADVLFVYAGVFISIFTAAHYIYSAKVLVDGIKASSGA